VDEVLRNEFNVNYNKNYIYDFLNHMNWKLPRKRKFRYSESLHFSLDKQMLQIGFKDNWTHQDKDYTILFDKSRVGEIMSVLQQFFSSRELTHDQHFHNAPIWWPESLIQGGSGLLIFDNSIVRIRNPRSGIQLETVYKHHRSK